MRLGYHLNFKDPDGIALEFQAPNDTYLAVIAELNSSRISDDEVRRRAAELLQFGP
jgi:glyoxylase I family protein